MKKIYFPIVPLLAVIFSVSAQQQSAGQLRERIYMQTDKQIYMAGELIWIKIITTSESGTPVDLSKVAYVELLDGASSKAQVKLDVSGGTGEGCMTVPTTIPSDTYRIIAYTRYMRNEPRSVIFEKAIGVLNPLESEKVDIEYSETPVDRDPLVIGTNNTITLSAGQNTYGTRERVNINLSGLPADIKTLSISVAGSDGLEYLPATGMAEWSRNPRQNSAGTFSGEYLPEYEGHIITGTMADHVSGTAVYDTLAKPFIGFIGDNIRIFSGKQDRDGSISFFTKRISGNKELASAINNNSLNRYRINIESPYILDHEHKELPPLKLSKGELDRLLRQSVAVQVLYSFAGDSLNRFDVTDPYFSVKPRDSYLLEEYTRFPTMEETFIEFIKFVRFNKTSSGRTFVSVWRQLTGFSIESALVMLDGIPVFDHELIRRYNPALIKRIDVYFDRYVFGGSKFEGIVALYTFNNNFPDFPVDESTGIITYEGTQARRHFFSPVYGENAEKDGPLPDYRHTLYWDPDVKTDGESAKTIHFHTSDLTGSYLITVEGLTDSGNPVYATAMIDVE